MAVTTNNPFRLSLKNRLVARAIERLLGLRQLAAGYDQRPSGVDTEGFLTHILDYLKIRLQILDKGNRLGHIPRSGPLLIVANHPLGGLEGVAIPKMMMAIRPDIKVLTNQLLTRIPELRPIFIGVNVLSENATRENLRGIREVMRHLCDGGALLMFPAGTVASINMHNRRVEDPAWNRLAGKLLQRSRATCLPIHVGGYNSRLFYSLGLIHPLLRTALLPRELANKENRTLPLTIGELIAAEELQHLTNDRAITDYLRLKTEQLNLIN